MCKMTEAEISAMSNKDLAAFLGSHLAYSCAIVPSMNNKYKHDRLHALSSLRRMLADFVEKSAVEGACDPVEFSAVDPARSALPNDPDVEEVEAMTYVIPPAVVREIISRLDPTRAP